MREVWLLKAGSLEIHLLRGGDYHRTARSRLVPSFDPAVLMRFVYRADQHQAVREYRAVLRRA